MPLRLSKALPIIDKLGVLDLAIKLKAPNLTIVMYHNIGTINTNSKTFEEPFPVEILEMHVKILLKNKYVITSLNDALNIITKGEKKRIAVLTFDDGYKGVYKYAFPILKKYHIKATLYLTSGFIREKIAPWWEQLYHLMCEALANGKESELVKLLGEFNKNTITLNSRACSSIKTLIADIVRSMDKSQLNSLIHKIEKDLGIKIPSNIYDEVMLSANEIKEMIEYGIEIGGHGLWHVNLTRITTERLVEEVRESMNFIKALYNNDKYTFAYPFGIYNNQVIEALKNEGFAAAVTMNLHNNKLPIINTYELGRIPPYKFNLINAASFKYLLLK